MLPTPHRKALQIDADPRPGTADACALIVDDDPMERLLLRCALERKGFTVVEAADGREALDLIEAFAPDLVILDIIMPGMDGFETCRRMRAMPSGARIPVMITTSLDDEGSIAEAYAAGATDFVTKPVNYALLLHRARYILRAHRVLANFDSLTGLPGRDVFTRYLDRRRDVEPAGGGSTAVLYLDLDRFRRINDTLGRACGDELLLKVAQRLRSLLRPHDMLRTVVVAEGGVHQADAGETLLARADGDAFIISLEGVLDPSDIDTVVRRLLDGISAPFPVRGETLHITASIGIALFDSHSVTPGTLIERAESAKDQVKRSGRNGWCFYDGGMKENARRVFALEKVLRKAIEMDRFRMHFQPKVDLQSGRLRGMEALMRLDYPGQGVISPVDFIPVAEQTGLIAELDRWALRESCGQARRCVDAGIDGLIVAVNVSAALFKEGDLARHLAQVLEESNLSPDRLEVELTERLLLEDTRASSTTLAALRELGVRVSMDDFGTGYSSLSYLKHFKVTGLKVDQSFVRDVTTDADDAAIVNAIIGLGQLLGLEVTAEGVETPEQAAFLRACGCHEAQGYLYSRALPVEDFIRWAAEYESRRGGPVSVADARRATPLRLPATGLGEAHGP